MARRRYGRQGPEPRPNRPARDLAELQQNPALGPPWGWEWAVCLCGTTLVHPPEWYGNVETRGPGWGRPVRPERTIGSICGAGCCNGRRCPDHCGAPYKRADGPAATYEYQPTLPPTLALAPRPWPLFATMAAEQAFISYHRRTRDVV